MSKGSRSSPRTGKGSLRIGVWQPEEHSRFLKGVVRYGKDWAEVEQVIATRQEKQIASHHQKYLTRVTRMVKKIKRKGLHQEYQDEDLEAETRLYRQLFSRSDITSLTPCQIKSMILSVCPSEEVNNNSNEPRKQRNIVLTDLSMETQAKVLPFLPLFPASQASETCPVKTSSSGWNPRARSFLMAHSSAQEDHSCSSASSWQGLDALTLHDYFSSNGCTM